MIAPIRLQQPAVIEYGRGKREVIRALMGDEARALVVCDRMVRPHISDLAALIEDDAADAAWISEFSPEPPLAEVESLRSTARAFAPTVVIGIGGGSSIDLAKVLCVLLETDASVDSILGIGNAPARRTRLIAIPTTAGTGSEVTPIAVLTDTKAQLKKGVVSPHLVPDAAVVDPDLCVSAPASVTAASGIDALVHCIEAYTNVHAHPAVDIYALEGIRLIGEHVTRAVRDGSDLEARSAMSLGSLYGGLCLGPVNTAAVHALAYPLGGTFKVSHGVANSMLLPFVMEFSAPSAGHRYAEIGEALGTTRDAGAAVVRVRELARSCGIPASMGEFGVTESDLDSMADAAMQVTRLMNNNPRPVTAADAREIYRRALEGA